MFQEMRRKDRELTRTDIDDILVKELYGVLSINDNNGYAYGVPMSYVYLDHSIYLHCALEGEKVDNMRLNNKVSFCVVGKVHTLPAKFSTEYESVIAFGKALEIHNAEKVKALMAFIHKYSRDYVEEGKQYIDKAQHKTAVIKINIEHITGKARN